MKIVCDACQAKYSIGDDKVQGKVFKIRCKKCSNIIVVRGNAAAEAAPAPQEKDTRVYDYGYDGGGGAAAPAGDDAVWHLVINQDQVGPMSVAEVQQRFSAGEIDGETFAWREGFADWLPVSQVDAFAAFASGGGGAAAHHDAGGGAMFGGDDGGGAPAQNDDLFAAASSSRGRSHADDGGGDLFGGSSKPAAASASASSGSKLRGERNENSVLFSLNNLAQLASDKPAPVASAPAGHATGAAGGEGSGLIDIRSMASAYMGSSGGGGAALGKPATASSIGSIDDLPVFGGGGFSEPAVIVPMGPSRGRDNKLLYLMIGAVALLAVVAVVMVVLLMKGGNKNPQVAANDTKSGDTDKAKDSDKAAADKDSGSAAAAPAAAAAPTPAPAAAAPTAAVAAAAPAPAPAPTAAAPAPAPAPAPSHGSPAHSSSHSAGNTVASASHTPKADPTPPPAPKDSSAGGGGGGCDEVSCLVGNGGACCARYNKKGGGGGGGGGGGANSNLPEALDRDMIQGGVGAVHGRVAACGGKFPGVSGKVKIHVKVGSDGHVSNASVETSPDPGLGSCVQGALSHASFPKTQNGGSFGYPFVFPM